MEYTSYRNNQTKFKCFFTIASVIIILTTGLLIFNKVYTEQKCLYNEYIRQIEETKKEGYRDGANDAKNIYKDEYAEIYNNTMDTLNENIYENEYYKRGYFDGYNNK